MLIELDRPSILTGRTVNRANHRAGRVRNDWTVPSIVRPASFVLPNPLLDLCSIPSTGPYLRGELLFFDPPVNGRLLIPSSRRHLIDPYEDRRCGLLKTRS